MARIEIRFVSFRAMTCRNTCLVWKVRNPGPRLSDLMETKYPRTWHFPFSPGVSGDDHVQDDWESCLAGKRLIYTEKLDGGNTMLSRDGVFARSHTAPASHPSFDYLKPIWSAIRASLGNLCIYGENLYGVHS